LAEALDAEVEGIEEPFDSRDVGERLREGAQKQQGFVKTEEGVGVIELSMRQLSQPPRYVCGTAGAEAVFCSLQPREQIVERIRHGNSGWLV